MKILLGLSGGVDSAVAAHLLLEQGHDVIAGFMKNYADEDNPNCITHQDRQVALEVAKFLNIDQFITYDFVTEYHDRIIQYIYDGYAAGVTPNPDVLCNSLVKFDLFLEEAIKLGCDAIATGHYARVLRRSKDTTEDKKDVLARMNASAIDQKTYDIIGLCMKIHSEFGNVLTEKQYENILLDQLKKSGFKLGQQIPIEIIYEGKKYGNRFIDILVDNEIVIELKKCKTEYELKKGFKQSRSYLELGNYKAGLLIDFGGEKLRYHRLNNYKYTDSNISTGSPGLSKTSSTESSDQSYYLLKGIDPNKDQSYFLSGLDQDQLSKSVFPLGDLTKDEVRKIATDIGLPNADRPDSQGLCFIGKVPIKEFLSEALPKKPGNIVDTEGKILGEHDGAHFVTIGQRTGLGLSGGPRYVVSKDTDTNKITVSRDEQKDLMHDSLIATNIHRISEVGPKIPRNGRAQIRYRQDDQECTITYLNKQSDSPLEKGVLEEIGKRGDVKENNSPSQEDCDVPPSLPKRGLGGDLKSHNTELLVTFTSPQRAISPGQIIVFYDGDEVVGNGVIKSVY